MSEFEEVTLDVEEGFGFSPEEADTFELSIPEFRDQPGIQYPAVLLSGIYFMDCLRVLKSRKRDSYREMEAWMELPDEGGFKRIGTLQMDSDMLIVLRYLRINATLYYDSEHLESLNLNDPEVLEKFI